MKKYNVISLFSGAGGLDYGFQKAGYSIIGSAEIMKEAIETHNCNFSLNSKPIDLTNELEYKKFIARFQNKKIDLLIGGFPCQGYSLAGKRSLKDERNQLYKKVVSILNDFSINKFVLENVPGILSMNNGREIAKIQKYFGDNDLYFQYVVLDSSNFKVPQKRKRVIFIGSRNRKDLNQIQLIIDRLKKIKNKIISVKDAISDLENINENKEFSHIFTKHTSKIKKQIKKVRVGESLYESYSDGWRKLDYDRPSPTVKENHGGVHLHPIKNRALTPRELARLQSFPDNFVFKGSKKAQLIQIGNAVPVNLAEIIARQIKNFVGKKYE